MEELSKVEKFDWKETIFANLVLVPFFVLISAFTIKAINILNTFNEDMKLIGLIVFMFSLVRLVRFLGTPVIIFKTKKGKIVYRG